MPLICNCDFIFKVAHIICFVFSRNECSDFPMLFNFVLRFCLSEPFSKKALLKTVLSRVGDCPCVNLAEKKGEKLPIKKQMFLKYFEMSCGSS